MNYSFLRSVASHLKPGLIRRALTEVRPEVSLHFTLNYLAYLYQQQTNGVHPGHMNLEITTRCERDCHGCYVTEEEKLII